MQTHTHTHKQAHDDDSKSTTMISDKGEKKVCEVLWKHDISFGITSSQRRRDNVSQTTFSNVAERNWTWRINRKQQHSSYLVRRSVWSNKKTRTPTYQSTLVKPFHWNPKEACSPHSSSASYNDKSIATTAIGIILKSLYTSRHLYLATTSGACPIWYWKFQHHDPSNFRSQTAYTLSVWHSIFDGIVESRGFKKKKWKQVIQLPWSPAVVSLARFA